MKVSEMSNEGTYFLCPDKTCKLFWDTTRRVPCERNCPRQDQLVKLIICVRCGDLISLPGSDHDLWARVDHNCFNGRCAGNFQRMSGQYGIVYEMPEGDRKETDNE